MENNLNHKEKSGNKERKKAERIQSASGNKHARLPACCLSNKFASSLKVALAPRDPHSWVTKREGRWEESTSCIAGSYSIVIKRAGVSSETPCCSCEWATHRSGEFFSNVETHAIRSPRAGTRKNSSRIVKFFTGFSKSWLEGKSGVAGE